MNSGKVEKNAIKVGFMEPTIGGLTRLPSRFEERADTSTPSGAKILKSPVDTRRDFWFSPRPFKWGSLMYAIVETGSKQYRVTAGDKLEIEHLEVEAGNPVTLDRVLFVNNDGKISVGAPTVDGATVVAEVLEHKRGKKLVAFKMKRRKGYHKKIGHRQELTVIQIKEINA